jgi:PadR family transcriptional regulator
LLSQYNVAFFCWKPNKHEGKNGRTAGHIGPDGAENSRRAGPAARLRNPLLLKLEQEGSIASEWGASENNRKARFYRLTRNGRKQLETETQDWEQTAAIIGRFFAAKAEDLK